MTEAYIDKNYVYAVSRVKGQELRLLNKQALGELSSTKKGHTMVKALKEKGWGKDSDITVDDVLKSEKEKLWEFIDEIVPDRSIFNVFRIANDYHNLKAAIKESTMEYPYEGIYMQDATMDIENIRESIKNRTYGNLPEEMIEVAEEAHSTFLQTGDGQLCDMIVDNAALVAIKKAGKNSGNGVLDMYSELVCASADIKICMRAAATLKDRSFLERALVECETLDVEKLITATLGGTENICSYLSSTNYVDAVPEIRKSLASFEKWCDDLVINSLKPQLSECFGLGPIIAYILAKENEIKTVRIIYTGLKNDFSDEMIKERVRETYV